MCELKNFKTCFFGKIEYINSANNWRRLFLNFIYIAGHSADSVAMTSPQYWSESHRGSDKKFPSQTSSSITLLGWFSGVLYKYW